METRQSATLYLSVRKVSHEGVANFQDVARNYCKSIFKSIKTVNKNVKFSRNCRRLETLDQSPNSHSVPHTRELIQSYRKNLPRLHIGEQLCPTNKHLLAASQHVSRRVYPCRLVQYRVSPFHFPLPKPVALLFYLCQSQIHATKPIVQYTISLTTAIHARMEHRLIDKLL